MGISPLKAAKWWAALVFLLIFSKKTSRNTNAAFPLAAKAAKEYFTQRAHSNHEYLLYGRRAIH